MSNQKGDIKFASGSGTFRYVIHTRTVFLFSGMYIVGKY